MKAKDYLLQYKKMKRVIANSWAEVEQWKAVAMSITAHTDGERVQSSSNPQRMASAVEIYSDIEAEIRKKIAESLKIQRDIISTIEQLRDDEYDLLYKVYILDMLLKEVAASRGKSKSWADSLHGIALGHVQRILDKRENDR